VVVDEERMRLGCGFMILKQHSCLDAAKDVTEQVGEHQGSPIKLPLKQK